MSAETVEPLPATKAGLDWQEILSELWWRRIMQSPQMEIQRLISDHYGGRMAVPLPEVDAEERPAVANIIAQVLDQHAMRIASVSPTKRVYPADPKKVGDQAKARMQRRVLFEWDDQNQMDIFDGRRARWIVGLGQAPVLIRPNAVTRQPQWELRNPLGTYPTPVRPYDDMRPDDCIFTYVRTYAWLKQRYPRLSTLIQQAQPANRKYRNDTRLEVIEYVDKDALVLGVLGGGVVPPYGLLAQMGYTVLPVPTNAAGQVYAVELERVKNLAGVCPAIVPNRVTVDVLKGQLDDMLGIFQMEAKMMALHVNAVARAIYSDWVFVEQPQGGGEIVTMPDGLKGIIGHVRGGTLQPLSQQVGAATMPAIQALERNAAVSGAYTPEFSGDSPTNVRTAQRGLNVASNAIDFYIQEHQKILGYAKTYEYEIAAEIDAAYFPRDKKTIYVDFGKDAGAKSYVPAELWSPVPKIKVRYMYAGMDANAIALVQGQKLNQGLVSRQSVMEFDTTIDDVETEQGRISAERAVATFEQFIEQQIGTGQLAGIDLARYTQLVRSGEFDPEAAYMKVHEEVQTRQASSGPLGSPEGPVAPGSPQAQLGAQGGLQGAAPPTTQGPNPSQKNLGALLGALAAGQSVRGG